MFGLLAFAAAMTHAETTLWMPEVFGDSMVLQRGMSVPVWGKSVPNGEVTISVQGQSVRARADAEGRWKAKLAPLRVSKAETMTVRDAQTNLSFANVAVGDVWICSGQSNMEWPMAAVNDSQAEIAAANHPDIRLFQVKNNADPNWQGDVEGAWAACNPATVGGFSAVGYFFGRSLHRTENVPIGLIDTTWGGTLAEAWTPKRQAGESPFIAPQVQALNEYFAAVKAAFPNWQELLAKRQGGFYPDTGNLGEALGWAAPGGAYDHQFERIEVPVVFSTVDRLKMDGAVWFRTNFELTEVQAKLPATLNLGSIDDFDVSYINGARVGATGPETPNAHQVKRSYAIPAGVLRTGTNTVAIRVYDMAGEGGFAGPPAALNVAAAGGAIPLSGDWGYRIERAFPDAVGQLDVSNQPNVPSALFEAMVRPLVPFGIKGAIWYQGESNASKAKEYQSIFPGMIQAWREEWGQGDFPFLFVQLANFMKRRAEPGDSQWAELREAQTMTLSLPNTGMAVIIDVGEANDIHPRDKHTVGERLAMSARAMLFPRSAPKGNSPLFATADFRPGYVRLNFKNGRGLRTTDGQEPIGFAVRAEGGADWVWGKARIDRDSVIVEHPAGEPIREVRYAWADNPAVNIVNGLGLPMSPFRVAKS